MEYALFIPEVDRMETAQQTAVGLTNDTFSLGLMFSPAELILDTDILHGLQAFLETSEIAAMYREFLRLTRERMELLRGNPHGEVVQSTSHTIAGTAGMLGACQVACRAKDIGAAPGPCFSLEIARMYAACDTLSHTLRTSQVKL
jgi:hypothetical protein